MEGEGIPLLNRPFRTATRAVAEHSASFTLLQFNTLANSLSDAFPYVDGNYLKWEHRKQLLSREILQHNPDVACLEEVDQVNYNDYFKPILAEAGFEGIFKKKVDELAKDGCCLFYRASKFSLEEKKEIRYMEGNSQVAILTRLKGKEGSGLNGKDISVMVTHLKSKVGNEERRLQQGQILLKAVEDFLQGRDIPVFILGDFNDTQGSPVYNYFKRVVAYKEGEEEKHREDTSLHPFEFHSAYAYYDTSGVEPYTTFKKREKEVIRTIDYIWFTPNKGTSVQGLLEIPSIEQLPNRLPASNYPSDHLAIASRFTCNL